MRKSVSQRILFRQPYGPRSCISDFHKGILIAFQADNTRNQLAEFRNALGIAARIISIKYPHPMQYTGVRFLFSWPRPIARACKQASYSLKAIFGPHIPPRAFCGHKTCSDGYNEKASAFRAVLCCGDLRRQRQSNAITGR